MSGEELPAYLKSLEAMLAGTAGAPPPPSQPTAQPLSLSSIGFGSSSALGTAPDPNRLQMLLVSTHVHQFTGYAKVSHGILTELAKQPWLQVTHFGFQRFHDLPASFRQVPPGVDVIDAAATEKPIQQGFGFAALPDVIRRKKPQVVMIYNDLAVVTQFLEVIRKSGIPRTFKVWVYCDQVFNTQMQDRKSVV